MRRLRLAAAALIVAGVSTMGMATGSLAVPLPTSDTESLSAASDPQPDSPTESDQQPLEPGDTVSVANAGGPPPRLALPAFRTQVADLAGRARVEIPALGAAVAIVPSGTAGGHMVVPSRLDQVGWMRGTSPPGASRGVTLLATHRDSTTARSPLFDLMRLRKGARIRLVDFRGEGHVFRVVSKARYERAALPGGLFADYGPRRLVLTTCTGPYELGRDGRLHWQRNGVVVAVPVGESRR